MPGSTRDAGPRYRILGPLEVQLGERPARVGGPQRRAVLAALLLNANRTVSTEHLIGLLWDRNPPATARSLVHGCVARLRTTLDAGADGGPLITRPPGYLLRIRPGELDLDEFTALTSHAGERDDGDASGLLRRALALWRGPALADIALPGIRAAAVALDERRVSALERRIHLDLAAGRHEALVGELADLVRIHPLRERMWAQLMVARYAAQRPAEALATYRELRQTLVDQLGIEPSERVRRLERAILADEDVLAVYLHGPGARPSSRALSPAPRRLPRTEPGDAHPRAASADKGPRAAPADKGPRTAPADAASGLVGRTAELAQLRAAVAGMDSGPGVLAVVGDPGIGKTRLLTELAGDARSTGRVVLAGRAAEFEQGVPFAVFRNALEDHLRTLPPDRLTRLAADERRLVLTAFPALTAPFALTGETGPVMVAADRYRLHRAIRTVLELIASSLDVPDDGASRGGLVLILDDLHWCDEGSAELLAHLLRHPPTARVLLVLAYRPRQLTARLLHEIAAAARRGTVSAVHVGPLALDEAAAMLPPGLSPQRVRQLYETGRGNPFYLEILARGPADDDPASESPPPSIRAALAGELASLTPQQQRVAHAAALAGDVFDPPLVAAIAEVAEEGVLDAIDELSVRDLIRPADPGFRFRHPLLRSAAYQHARPGWRVAAHARAAAESARRGGPLAERAGHIAGSATPGDQAAVDVLHAAAVEAMNANPAAAAHWLHAALRLLPRRPHAAPLRLQLLNLRARALGITGHLVESRDILQEVLAMVPAGTDERVAAAGFLTMVEHLLGNHARARALLAGELGTLQDPFRGTAAATLRVASVVSGILHGAVDVGEIHTAIDVARDTGDRPLLSSALAVGAVAGLSFDLPQSHTTQWADEAAVAVDAMPDPELARRLDAALYLGWADAYLERFGTVTRLRRALRIARSTGQNHLVSPLGMLIGVLHCMVGDLAGAAVALDDAMESTLLTGGAETRGRLLLYQSWVKVWAGDVDTALILARESVRLTTQNSGIGWQAGQAETNLAFVRYAAGDPHGCLETIVHAGRGPDLPAVRQVWRPMRLELLSAAAAAAGRHREATTFADTAAALPVIGELPRRAAMILMARVHPLLHTAPADAAGLAQEAATLYERSGDRLGAAQARLYAGLAHRTAGDHTTAQRLVDRARLGFAACGARPHWLARITGIPLDEHSDHER